MIRPKIEVLLLNCLNHDIGRRTTTTATVRVVVTSRRWLDGSEMRRERGGGKRRLERVRDEDGE